jgi:hypothetical protein
VINGGANFGVAAVEILPGREPCLVGVRIFAAIGWANLVNAALVVFQKGARQGLCFILVVFADLQVGFDEFFFGNLQMR